jgi:LAS superfamily LD-carboxypeptidase LdcB
VPGYSRHHTGYTIDLWCEDGSSTFLSSSCYKWISDNNYLKAKQSGWIPSYPAGTDDQGPEPEPWEYVWVGTERLME